MAKIVGGNFEGDHVDVDGNHYEQTTFKNVEIRYNGGIPPAFIDCTFDGCTLGLGGPAGNTIGYLAAIYHGFGEWGRVSTETLFKQIRENKPSGVGRPAEEVATGDGDA